MCNYFQIVAMEKGCIRIQGSLKEIRERDPSLHAQWHEMISKKEAELQRQLEAKTAKERWTLLKLVSKIGLQFRAGRHREIIDPKLMKIKKDLENVKALSHITKISRMIFHA